MSQARPIVNVLWTGGLDSSFRMVQLSRLDVRAQPYYVSDDRESEPFELNAIKRVTEDIKAHPGTIFQLLPLIIVPRRQIEPDPEITEAYRRVCGRHPIGWQYEWLARLSKSVDGLEIGLERPGPTGASRCIANLGRTRVVRDGPVPYAVLDPESSDPDLFTVFGRFHFPLPLFEFRKLDELPKYREWGFGSTIDKTWFCHWPIKGRPCGYCKPCVSLIHEGLAFRFTRSGLRRYRLRAVYNLGRKIKAVIRQKLGTRTDGGARS
ncbi:MAG: hypothetical protein JW775_04120 [Candidatus Aminicenantes bacterium]|nr:hypothetical protein [Candidatus Aminicenantes bacterium]